MPYHADLHIHSKYSRACSKDCDLEHLTWWARRKGITLVGTGDFTHPAWFAHLRETLVPAEPGLFRMRPELDAEIGRLLPPQLAARPVRFMLSVEISTIYKRGERTRKVHHLVYLPDFEAAAEFNRRLGRIGNLGSDGRPILGLDSRDLLEIVLECGEGGYLVPAHVWTPWFAVLGSKSGFDAIEDCYLDLGDHIFALETGLSSDPAMNWRISGLDRFRMVSNSDAHSPPMLGRETTLFDTELDYFAIRRALETGDGHLGSVEFFPEEGKYHVDGHRKCHVRLEPRETRELGGVCPQCGRPLTVGVLSRVEELADRPEGYRPEGAADFRSLVPLPEVVSEILGVGPKSKRVRGEIDRLTAELGPELAILDEVPVDAVTAQDRVLGEAVARLRRGEVIREAGYDGEYGTIRLFEPGELTRFTAVTVPALFEEEAVAAPEPASRPTTAGGGRGGRAGSASAPRGGAPAEPAEGEGPAHGAARADGAETAGGARPAPGGRGARGARAGASGEPPAGRPDASSTPRPAAPGAPDGAVFAGAAGAGAGPEGAAPAGGPAGAAAPSELPSGSPAGAAVADPAGGLAAVGAGLIPGPRSGEEGAASTAPLLDGLDPEQRAAAAVPAGPLLIVAGPGTGKTRTLTHRLAHLVTARDVPPEGCLAITFTRRAAEELAERLAALAPAQAPRVTVATFHSLGQRVLREQHARAGLSADFGIADEARQLAVAEELAGGAREARRLLAERPPEYLAALRARDLVDFDDLVALPLALLEGDEELTAAYRARFPWVFVDEYQDVDERQYRLLRRLAPPDGNLTAIGDPDQAIYRFRGADVGFFLRFGEDFPTARTVRLSRNYRSGSAILAAAGQVVAPSTLVPGRSLQPMGGHGSVPVELHRAATERAEASFVARTIDQLLGGATFHAFDSGRVEGDGDDGLGLSDFAVLYRTDRQAQAVADALGTAGLPFQKRSHDRLADRPGVARLVDALAAAASTGGPETPLVDQLARAAEEVTEVSAAGSSGVETGETGENGANGERGENGANGRRGERGAPEGAGRAEVLSAAELLTPLAQRCGTDLERFRAELALGVEVDTWDPRADRISLLTLHASKGLEFPVVFLVGCEDGLLPLRWPGAEPSAEELAEERRLLFVGMTRAQRRLVVSHAAERVRHGAARATRRSPFLADVDPALWARQERAPVPRQRPRDTQLRLM